MNGGQEGLPKGPLEKWMWKGKSLSDAMKEFIMAGVTIINEAMEKLLPSPYW